MLGVAYKPDIDDTRESPALKLIELLRDEGGDVSYHDPHVPQTARARASSRSSSTPPIARVRLRRRRHRPLARSTTPTSSSARSSSSTSATPPASAGTRERQGRQAVTVRIGVVGLGYWGPNVVRNMARVADLAWCCDLSEENRDALRAAVPAGALHGRLRRAAQRPDARRDRHRLERADAPPARHARARGRQARVHREAARGQRRGRPRARRGRRGGRPPADGRPPAALPPGACGRCTTLIDSGELGDIYYLYGNRVNLGKVRADENALWSLGAHDVAVLLDLVGERPIEAQARGECYVRPDVEDVVFGYLKFPSGVVAHLHLSWLDPHKTRKLTVVGSQKMVVFDDMETDRKVTIYDKSASRAPSTDSYGEYVSVRFGDISIPRIPNDEPLRLECQEFVDAIGEGARAALQRPRGPRGRRGARGDAASLDDGGRVDQTDRHDACAPTRAARTCTSATTSTIGEGVEFGANVVVHDGCSIGAGTRASATTPCSASARRSAASSTAQRDPLPGLAIGEGCTISTRRDRVRRLDARRRRDRRRPRGRARARRRSARDSVVGRGATVENDTTHRRARAHPGRGLRDRLLRARGRRLHRALRRHDERQLHGPHRAPAARS